MPKSKSEIVARLPEEVQVINDDNFRLGIGGGHHDLRGFSLEKVYKPIAIYIYKFDDGSGLPVFLIPDDSGAIREMAVQHFKVVA